jgi:hypothetical protein
MVCRTQNDGISRRIRLIALLTRGGLGCGLTGGCATADDPAESTMSRAVSVVPLSSQTCEHLGACQGVYERHGFTYLYGNASPGVIRQYTVTPAPPRFISSLSRHGESPVK